MLKMQIIIFLLNHTPFFARKFLSAQEKNSLVPCLSFSLSLGAKEFTWGAKKIYVQYVIRYESSYRVFIKYCVFSWKCCDFCELCQFYCSAGVLPAWYVYTRWHRGKTESGVLIYSKKTQYLMITL